MAQPTPEQSIGKAYWLTNCPLSLEELLPLMPDTTDAAQSPPDLKLNFVHVQSPKPSPRLDEVLGAIGAYGLSVESLEQYAMPEALKPVLESAKDHGLTYIVEASLPGATNKQVEGELSTIASLAFNPAFFPNNATYKGAVLSAQADGSYALRDEVPFTDGQEVD